MTEMVHDTSRPVMVTGATGYLAGWIVAKLLDHGYTVHAAVRDPDNEDKTAHLTARAAAAPGLIRFFKADLLDEGSYGPAMAGCQVVFHTASPFTTHVADPQRDLVDPAVEGTRNVLASVDETDSVERVVLTSSCAAIYGDNADIPGMPEGKLTEDVWNSSSSIEHQAYSYSKTQAEKAAWEMAKAQERWRLVAINPSFIIGPGLKAMRGAESFALVKQMADGTMKTGAPDLPIGAVDVRDVAEAHLRAAFIPEASGRHIVSAENTSLFELASRLREAHGDRWPFPKSTLPNWLVWLVGPMINKALTRRVVSRNMGRPFVADNSRSRRALGLDYAPVSRAIVEMFDQMVEAGLVKGGRKAKA